MLRSSRVELRCAAELAVLLGQDVIGITNFLTRGHKLAQRYMCSFCCCPPVRN